MVKIICDRCGQIIKDGIEGINSIYIPDLTGNNIHYDLCDECIKKLALWLNGKETIHERIMTK